MFCNEPLHYFEHFAPLKSGNWIFCVPFFSSSVKDFKRNFFRKNLYKMRLFSLVKIWWNIINFLNYGFGSMRMGFMSIVHRVGSDTCENDFSWIVVLGKWFCRKGSQYISSFFILHFSNYCAIICIVLRTWTLF